MIKSEVQTAQKLRFKQPSVAVFQKIQKVQVEDIQISNDGSTTAIKVQKAKRLTRFKIVIMEWKIFKLEMMEVQWL